MLRLISLLALISCALAQGAEKKIQNFLFIGGSDPQEYASKLTDQIDGVQIIYSWKSLEPEKDKYAFEKIERDLKYLESKNKKLWIQLQDRFFDVKDRNIPDYLLQDKIYQGGLAKQKDYPGEGSAPGSGWVSKQWNPQLRARFQKLIAQLAQKLDGRIHGINLPETAADIEIKTESLAGFSCDQYFGASLENIRFAKNAFKKSHVVQYINFWPCEWENDRKYMSRFFEEAQKLAIGLGGPDIVPYRKGQLKNSYPFFNKYQGKLSIVAFAVQEPTRTYTNPNTGKKFTNQEFLDFAKSFLGVDVIFWSVD
jgi:hypothetical protein